MDTVRGVMQILLRIERQELINEKDSGRNELKKSKRKRDGEQNDQHKSKAKKDEKRKGKSDIKNPCKLSNHSGYDWKDCRYNAKSDNFCGTARSVRDYNDDGSLKEKKRTATAEVTHISPKTSKRQKTISWSDDSDSEESRAMSTDKAEAREMGAEMLVSIPLEKSGKKCITIVALFDTGSSKSLIDEKLVSKLKGYDVKNTSKVLWKTEAGSFTTSKEILLEQLRLPQFTTKRKVDFKFTVFSGEGGYDAIIGRDFGHSVEINVLNKNKTFEWDNVEIPMVSRVHWTGEHIEEFHEECKVTRREELRRAEILDAKYEKIDIEECVQKQGHLDPVQREQLPKLLRAKIVAFQGTRGRWKGKPVTWIGKLRRTSRKCELGVGQID